MDKELPGQTTPGITVLEEALLWHKIYYGEGILALLCLAALSHTNYLPFHVCIEILVVAVAITLFSIGWNARHITRNNEFIQLAIAFLPIGLIHLLHTLSYNGMGVFPEFGRNMPTQLWISTRGMQSAA